VSLERITGLCPAAEDLTADSREKLTGGCYSMEKRKRRRSAVLGMVGVLFIVFLVSVVNFDMRGGNRNSMFFILTCFLATMSGVAFIVMLCDPWGDNTVK
jgi:bacteriorhodopsin